MSVVPASSYSWFENDVFYKKRHLFFSRGTRAQHLTLCGVWCPLDGCDALIGQRSLDNCTVTMSVYSTCVHQVVAQHSHESSKNFGMSVDVAWFPDFGHIVAGIFLFKQRIQSFIKLQKLYIGIVLSNLLPPPLSSSPLVIMH